MTYINLIYVFILYSKEYTTARSPHEFCANIYSPALTLPVDKNGNILLHLIVQQETKLQTTPNYQFISSSGENKPVRDFDLNQIPPDETE